MADSRNIFVALDLDSGELDERGFHTLEQAVKLAKQEDQGRVCLIHVFDVSSKVQTQMESSEPSDARVHYQRVADALQGLQVRVTESGVQTETKILFGKTWLSLIREVMREEPDILLAGAARRKPFLEALFGSTSMKLLRKCPCPVWVTKDSKAPTSILVAHDRKQVGSAALRWGVKTAKLHEAKLHVLHVLEVPGHDSFLTELPKAVVARESKQAEEEIEAELKSLGYLDSAEIVVVGGQPQLEIFNYLKGNGIDLLIMGTLGRSGIAGFITGNTAETLLPWVRCSLIALKPEGFETPVKSK